MTANFRQHTSYQRMIKRAIARSGGSTATAEMIYQAPATAPQADETAEIIAAVKSYVAEIETAPVETAAAPEPVKVELPLWKPDETKGFPAARDTFHIVTLTTNVYNGYRFALPESGDTYPVYLIANQDGEIMRTVGDDDPKAEKAISYHYRSTGLTGDETASLALRDIKQLKKWQRYHYGKQEEKADTIKLTSARVNGSTFTVTTAELLQALRKLSKKAYTVIMGYAFPADTLAAMLRLADDSTLEITVKDEITRTIPNSGNTMGFHDKTAPGMEIRHGSTKTMLWGFPLNFIPGKTTPELIPVVF